MLSIGALSSAAQGASYYERDGYYAKDDPEHREASAWAGRGAEELGLKGPVDPDVFRAVLEGKVPDGSGTELGKRGKDGKILHRPGRDLTFSAPKSVSLAALVGGDRRIVDAHDRAVAAALDWVERNAAETRMKDPETGRMVRAGNQKIVAANFRHDTSRNLDPQLHTHAVLANMVQGEDGKWRTMANEKLYGSKMLLGALYRSELAAGLSRLGYGIEKTHADGRFEIAGVPRAAIDAFSSRRAEIEAAMEARDLGSSADNPRLAERAALMTRAKKRDIDRDELRSVWQRQAADLGFDAKALVTEAEGKSAAPDREAAVEPASGPDREAGPAAPPQPDIDDARGPGAASMPEPPGERTRDGDGGPASGRETGAEAAPPSPATEAVAWAMAHLSEREAVFSRNDLFAAALAYAPGAAAIGEVEREVAALEKAGTLHAVDLPGAEASLTTDRTVGEERETVALWRSGQARGRAPMRSWQVQGHLNKGPLTAGQKDAVTLILSAKDRTVGIQGYAGTGKTTMLNRAQDARGEEGLAHGGARALGLGRADARFRGRDRERDPAALPRPQRGSRRRSAIAEGRARDARRVREDDPGGRRGLARLHRAGARPAQDRQRAPHPPRGAGGRREAARCGGRRQALRPAPGRRHADRDHGRDHAPARSGAEGSGRGEPQGRHREGVREAREQRRGGQTRQYRRRGRRPLAPARRRRARQHRRDGALPRAAPGHQRPHPRAPRAGGPHPRPHDGERTAGLEGLHQRREVARRQLRTGRRGRLPPAVQADRRREGRRAPRHGRRPRGPRGAARRRHGRPVAWKPEEIGGAGAAARSTRSRRSSSGPATASAGRATMPASGWSTAARRKCSRSPTAG